MSDSGIERRRWPRIPASSLGDVSATLVAGPEVRLVNLSRGGALLEITGRLPLRSAVRLKLAEGGRDLAVAAGRVVWQKVSAIVNGHINYRVAVVFEQPIPELASAATGDARQDQQDGPAGSDVAESSSGVRPTSPAPPLTLVPARDNLTRFPSVTGQTRIQPVSDARADELRKQLAAATADLACQSAVLESLAAKLKESDRLRAELRRDWETERRQWEDERGTLARQAADAVTRADALQAALDSREAAQAQSLREQQARHEAIVAELVKTTNDQHAEYQDLLEQVAASNQEGQRWRARREETEARRRELEARLEAAEALCAVHDDRFRALQRETEKLLMMITSPVQAGTRQTEEPTAPSEENLDKARAAS